MNKLLTILATAVVGVACLANDGSPKVRPADSASPLSTPIPSLRPSPSPTPSFAADFTADVRLLFRVVACGENDEPLPENLDRATLDEHCAWLKPRIEGYRHNYLAAAGKFLARLRPPNLPTTLVYPFGGGDLLSALTTYPAALEITTISLEHAGDPRRLRSMGTAKLKANLATLRKSVTGLLCCNDSTSESLIQMEKTDLPGQLSFFLIGLALHDYQPVGLRYFDLEADGTVHYLTPAEIQESEGRLAKKLNQVWVSPSFSRAFSNAEMIFRPRGAPEGSPSRVHRHIAANLSDQYLKKDNRLLAHLSAKGEVIAMTKAASYCLWNAAFVKIRDYLLKHMVFMISDSTGIPPQFAQKAGFAQETYGRFTGPFLEAKKEYGDAFVKLWSDQPKRPLPIRYGYVDADKHYHLLVTRRSDRKAVGGSTAQSLMPSTR